MNKTYRAAIEKLSEQERLADDYVNFLHLAINKGFAINIIVEVDGQVSKSAIMTNAHHTAGNDLLRYIYNAAAGQRLKIKAQRADLIKWTTIKKSPEIAPEGA